MLRWKITSFQWVNQLLLGQFFNSKPVSLPEGMDVHPKKKWYLFWVFHSYIHDGFRHLRIAGSGSSVHGSDHWDEKVLVSMAFLEDDPRLSMIVQ